MHKITNESEYREMLLELMDEGLSPVVNKKGPECYRFFINQFVEWHEGKTKYEACERAVNAWVESGKYSGLRIVK